MKTTIRTLFWILIFISFLIIDVFVHEFGHGIFAILVGERFNGIGIGFGKEFMSIFGYADVTYSRSETRPFICLGGIVFATIFFLIIGGIAYKKKKIKIFLISTCLIIGEFAYWFASPFISSGDAYNFICYLDINPIIMNIISLSLLLFWYVWMIFFLRKYNIKKYQ